MFQLYRLFTASSFIVVQFTHVIHTIIIIIISDKAKILGNTFVFENIYSETVTGKNTSRTSTMNTLGRWTSGMQETSSQ